MDNNKDVVKVNKMKFPPETAGRIMFLNAPVARSRETIGTIEKRLYRDIKKLESINYIYILDSRDRLAGAISIKDILRQPKHRVADKVMSKHLIYVHPHTDQERVAFKALQNNIKAVPVVDKHRKFLGVVTSDTILSVMYNESREDLMRLAGIHGKRSISDNVMEMPVLTSLKHRLPWLLIGLAGGILSARIITGFENTIQENLILASFIPLISYMGGATEAQLVTFIIRDTAMNPRLQFWRYFWRQFLVTLLLGILISGALYFIGFAFFHSAEIANVVGMALLAAIISSVVTGLLVPYAFSRLKVDPANASGPIATIIQDIIGITLYLTIASLLL